MRIVTRADFDGVVCAALLGDALDRTETIAWLEPEELSADPPRVQPGDVIANLPWHPAGSLWFDHHATNRIEPPPPGLFRLSPSAARNVYDHFAGRFTRDYAELVFWADRIDAADLSCEEILDPGSCFPLLLSLTLAPERGRREAYWNHLVRLLREGGLSRAAADPLVGEACREVLAAHREYERQLRACTRRVGRVAVSDFRESGPPVAGNRFLVYCLYPETVVSLRMRWADEGRSLVSLHVGHSIVHRGCTVHAGRLLARFGGGGHRAAASVRIPAARAEEVIAAVLAALVREAEAGDSPASGG
ncbi:MAG: DHH family phosphoesterase [Desulfobacterales bacterium]